LGADTVVKAVQSETLTDVAFGRDTEVRDVKPLRLTFVASEKSIMDRNRDGQL
jgi:hypothetical protein